MNLAKRKRTGWAIKTICKKLSRRMLKPSSLKRFLYVCVPVHLCLRVFVCVTDFKTICNKLLPIKCKRKALKVLFHAPVFCNPSPLGPKNNRCINFSLSKAWVYDSNCRGTLIIKALPKSLLKSWQENVNLYGYFGMDT